ncbi:MAG: helix-hairpin-helix domain-containing protein [Clostridium sp.]|uniref:helix-hairpin-helix domain-containing protein n=1 Tax=Clostridium sp. TaxID=1506 RepID=UPI003023CFC2
MNRIKNKIVIFIKDKVDKKTIALGILAMAALSFSFYLYGSKKEDTFQKPVMENIFIEEEKEDTTISNEENLLKKKEIVVEIKGEVNNPDVYYLQEGAIIKELIEKAGGATENAYLDNINRAAILNNNECINILNKNEIIADINDMSVSSINNQVSSLGGSGIVDGKVNLNKATLEDLKTLKGIGDAKAQDIIDYRDENSGFKSIDELKNVKGIGEKTFENLKDSIST